jgi:hypothetical protein
MKNILKILLPLISTLQLCANPMLSYLDDEELGTGETSIFGMIFNIIVWASLFYYAVLHRWVKKWKEQQQAKKNFTELVEHLYRTDKKLGECFSRNVTFVRFHKNKLYWNSHSEGEDRCLLNKRGEEIMGLVGYFFGKDTIISNEYNSKNTK